MESANGDPLAFYQKIFEQSYNLAKANKENIHRDVVRRRTIAYSLKAIAIFGGIAITAGLPVTAAHIVGIAIAVAVGIDSLFMNQLKLITLAKADNAYKYLLRDIENTHSDKLAPILVLKQTNQDEAMKQLTALIGSLKQQMDSESKKIELAKDESDVKVLDALSLDAERRSKASGA